MTHYIEEKSSHRESSFVKSSDNFGEQLVDYSDGRFVIKKESTEKCTRSVQAHDGPVYALVLTARGCLISAGADKSIKFWDVNTLECVNVVRDAHSEPIKALALCSNESLVASGSADKQIKLWSLSSFECVRSLIGHQGSVYALTVNVNNQDELFSGSFDNQIKLWDLKSGQVIKTLHGQYCFWSLMTTKRGELISGSSDSTVKFWDIKSNERDKECSKSLTGHESDVLSLAIVNDKHLISGSYKKIKIWNLEEGKFMKTLNAHENSVSALVTLDEQQFASGSWDQKIKIWSMGSVKPTRILAGHEGPVRALVIAKTSEGGGAATRLVSCSDDKTIKTWSI